MEWILIPSAFLLLLLAGFAASFLTPVWERRKKRGPEIDALVRLLPGHDCGLCGNSDCRSYAQALAKEDRDPGLCSPGGSDTEKALRTALGGGVLRAMRAVVRCGGTTEAASPYYSYEGAADCRAASSFYRGPKACVESCYGLGSCARVCPLGAISVQMGLARVDPGLCTGCGFCLKVCPTAVIALVPAEARWYVACNSPRKAEQKLADCKVACTGCGECVRRSPAWEFSLSGNLASASTSLRDEGPGAGAFADIAPHCPTGAILRAGGEKKLSSSS